MHTRSVARARNARWRSQTSGYAEPIQVIHGYTIDPTYYPKSWGPYDLMLSRVEANRVRDTQRMGEIEKEALARNARHRDWICDERRMGTTRGSDALYMHCLPADIGAEVSPGVMARNTVNVAREANWKVYVIMAALATA